MEKKTNYEKTKVAASLKSIVMRDPYRVLSKKLGKKYRDYRNKWRDAGKRTFLPDFPIHLDIDITDSCNLSCQYCLQNTHYGWTADLMEEEVFRKILKEAKREGINSVNIGWNTEPLVNQKLFLKMIDVLDEYKVMDVFLHTNAVGLSEEAQKRILNSSINTICFSMGAVGDLTRKKHLAKIKASIVNFRKMRDKMKKTLPLIRIGIIPMEENKKEIKGYIDFWRKYADYIELQDVTIIGREAGNAYKKNVFECNNPWRRLAVNSRGDIYPCCGFTFFSKNLKLGNIKNTSLKEAWNSKKIKGLRSALESGKLQKYPGCFQCLNNLYSFK